MMTSLTEQLATLTEIHASPKSESKEPTSLDVFLYIYINSENLCCKNDMEGAQVLYNWLSPFYSVPVAAKDYPMVPSLFRTYELTQLARIVSPDTTSSNWVTKRTAAENYIYWLVTER